MASPKPKVSNFFLTSHQTSCGHQFCKLCLLLSFKNALGMDQLCPYCRQKIKLTEFIGPLKSPWNKIYLQGGTRGLASYHFEPGGVYISYKNAHNSWKSSDGTPPPNKKYFVDPHFDEETRIFTVLDSTYLK